MHLQLQACMMISLITNTIFYSYLSGKYLLKPRSLVHFSAENSSSRRCRQLLFDGLPGPCVAIQFDQLHWNQQCLLNLE